jgi:hypothetical protein
MSPLDSSCCGRPDNDFFAAGVSSPAFGGKAGFTHQAVALLATAVVLVLHALQQRLSCNRADAGALEGLDFLPPPENLPAHVLNFIPDVVQTHRKSHFGLLEQKGNVFASYKLGVCMTIRKYPMAYHDCPDQMSAPMNDYLLATLRKLSIEAYQPKLFADDLTGKEAARRIETLKREIALANSF